MPHYCELSSAVSCTSALKAQRFEGPVYEPTSGIIDIDYPYERTGVFKIYSRHYRLTEDVKNPTSEKELLKQQITELLDNPSIEVAYTSENPFDRVIE
jgi:hypothetical protein